MQRVGFSRRETRTERGHGRRAALTVLATALLAWPGMARAHDLGVARAMLEELPGARYVLEVEVEPHLAPLFAPPELPERCGAPAAVTPDLGTLRYEFACAGEPLTAEDVLRLPWQRQGVMLTVRWADGATARQFIAGTGAAIEVPLNALRRAPARSGTPPCATSASASSTSCSASITCCSCSACCSSCPAPGC